MIQYKTASRAKIIPKKFIQSAHSFFARYVLKNGVQSLYDLTEAVQPGIFNNLMEQEGDRCSYTLNHDPYRTHIIAGLTKIIDGEPNTKLSNGAFVKLTQGLIALISCRKTLAEGDAKADTELDMAEVPAEFQSEDSSFERQQFQQLNSLARLNSATQPEIDSPARYFMQCLEACHHRSNVISILSDIPKEYQDMLVYIMNATGIQLK